MSKNSHTNAGKCQKEWICWHYAQWPAFALSILFQEETTRPDNFDLTRKQSKEQCSSLWLLLLFFPISRKNGNICGATLDFAISVFTLCYLLLPPSKLVVMFETLSRFQVCDIRWLRQKCQLATRYGQGLKRGGGHLVHKCYVKNELTKKMTIVSCF